MTLTQYSTVTTAIPFKAMLYSEDPSTAILASCGGIDIARPDDLQQMEVTYGSNERVK